MAGIGGILWCAPGTFVQLLSHWLRFMSSTIYFVPKLRAASFPWEVIMRSQKRILLTGRQRRCSAWQHPQTKPSRACDHPVSPEQKTKEIFVTTYEISSSASTSSCQFISYHLYYMSAFFTDVTNRNHKCC